MNAAKNIPEKKFSTGTVSATVWQNQGKTKAGEVIGFKTISLQRSYKDKNGVWQNTSSLRINDLPKAALVIQKSYEYIVLRERQDASGAFADEEIIEEAI